MYYTLYYYNRVTKHNVPKKEKIHLEFCTTLIKENPCISGPIQFRPKSLESTINVLSHSSKQMFCPTNVLPHKCSGQLVPSLSKENPFVNPWVSSALHPADRREEADSGTQASHNCHISPSLRIFAKPMLVSRGGRLVQPSPWACLDTPCLPRVQAPEFPWSQRMGAFSLLSMEVQLTWD